jgi:hypothetical protein
MSGSRTKQLRKAADGLGLQPRGWRNLKRAWNETPRPGRRNFDVVAVASQLHALDRARLEAYLRKLPRSKLEALYRRMTGKP